MDEWMDLIDVVDDDEDRTKRIHTMHTHTETPTHTCQTTKKNKSCGSKYV